VREIISDLSFHHIFKNPFISSFSKKWSLCWLMIGSK
jgi:hypothetical protein